MIEIEKDYPYRLGFAKALLREARANLRRDAKDTRKLIDDFFETEAEIAESREHSRGRGVPDLGVNYDTHSTTTAASDPLTKGRKDGAPS